jgi:hypothetical protein
MTREQPTITLRQIEFELERLNTAWRCLMTPSALHSCATARQRKLSQGLAARRAKNSGQR